MASKQPSQRTGLIAKKLGMTRLFSEDGKHVPVTVLQLDHLQVVGQRTAEKNGYTALQLGFGTAKVKNVTKALRGHYAKAKVQPPKKVAEFRVSQDMLIDVGAELSAAHFVPGQYVDTTGTGVGKGFAGVIKRHGFRGLRATHGVSVSHRSHGSTGGRQDPGRVFKGKKMAGHMGDVTVTTLNIQVVSVDADQGLIMLKGCVPGAEGSYVMLRDAVKKPRHAEAPVPAGLKAGSETTA